MEKVPAGCPSPKHADFLKKGGHWDPRDFLGLGFRIYCLRCRVLGLLNGGYMGSPLWMVKCFEDVARKPHQTSHTDLFSHEP